MRITVVALSAALVMTSPAALAEQNKNIPEVCVEKTSNGYECEWQKRLLAAQHRFAATLPLIDQTTTGSITHSSQ